MRRKLNSWPNIRKWYKLWLDPITCTTTNSIIVSMFFSSWLYSIAFQWVSNEDFSTSSGVRVTVGTTSVGRIRVMERYVIGKCYINSGVCYAAYNSSTYREKYYYEVCISWRPNSGHVPWGFFMMTSSNRNIFRVTGPLCGEFTGHRWIPRTTASDAELWWFFLSTPE